MVLDKIRKRILKEDLSKCDLTSLEEIYDIKVDNEALLNYFEHVIELFTTKSKVKLGQSKKGGLPHLPKGFQWPKGEEEYYFFAQLNIDEFKQYDLKDQFPDSGIIYYFVKQSGWGKAFYSNTSVDELVITEYPTEQKISKFMKNLVMNEYKLQFK
ncbi:MAG: DUF1963 domain-containing protein, partial [Desulfobacterales bacterium]|nr:DUF1963 domain-containing protein [Desulfobacterales bacterium]